MEKNLIFSIKTNIDKELQLIKQIFKANLRIC